MVLKEYYPIKAYGQLNKNINEINEKFNELNSIKESLVIFHKNKHIKVIQEISNIMNDIETKAISEFKTEAMKNSIDTIIKKYGDLRENKRSEGFFTFQKII
jgi:predicted nuclease with TOPRIM domain